VDAEEAEERMKATLLQEHGEKTYALIFDTGDEVAAGLLQFATQNRLAGSHFTAIGGFSDVTLGYLEVILVESPRHLWRKHDPTSGIALIDLATGTDPLNRNR
jgi:predicted DNA-binding protein with PD1-like motif